jgi:hypothetical protein
MSWRLGNSARLGFQTMLAALGKLNVSENINRAWENIREIIKTSVKQTQRLHHLKRHIHGLIKNI